MNTKHEPALVTDEARLTWLKTEIARLDDRLSGDCADRLQTETLLQMLCEYYKILEKEDLNKQTFQYKVDSYMEKYRGKLWNDINEYTAIKLIKGSDEVREICGIAANIIVIGRQVKERLELLNNETCYRPVDADDMCGWLNGVIKVVHDSGLDCGHTVRLTCDRPDIASASPSMETIEMSLLMYNQLNKPTDALSCI